MRGGVGSFGVRVVREDGFGYIEELFFIFLFGFSFFFVEFV